MRAVEFKVEEPFVLDVVAKYETIVRFLKKHGLRTVRGGPVERSTSIYELGKRLEENPSKW